MPALVDRWHSRARHTASSPRTPTAADDFDGLVNFAVRKRVDLTVVGPDDPIASGLVDLLRSTGLRVFGPTASAARLESSKAYAKNLMLKASPPQPTTGPSTISFKPVYSFSSVPIHS